MTLDLAMESHMAMPPKIEVANIGGYGGGIPARIDEAEEPLEGLQTAM